MNKPFSFKKQSAVGDQGEKIFLDKYTDCIKLGVKDDYDFYDEDRGIYLELKTDTYPLSKTKNHFIEKYSDDNTYKLGGPFRCTKPDSVFIYYHIKDDKAFFYDPIELVDIIENNFDDNDLISIRNKGYNTQGFKVPRELLKPALLHIESLKEQ